MKCRRATLVATVLAAVVGSGAAQAQTPAEFYKGKDIRLVIGAGVGGTYHLYAMLAARMMRKHIPGQPSVTLMAMPGAGGITAMNHSYNVAPKDGTMMSIIHAEVLFETLAQPGRQIQRQGLQLYRPLRRRRLRRRDVEAVRRQELSTTPRSAW